MFSKKNLFVVKPHPNTNAMITYLMLLCFFSVILYVFFDESVILRGNFDPAADVIYLDKYLQFDLRKVWRNISAVTTPEKTESGEQS